MATRKPLVIIQGQVQELPATDVVEGAVSSVYYEPLVAAGGITVALSPTGSEVIPNFLSTVSGDVIMGTPS